jgi:hypothetical protein
MDDPGRRKSNLRLRTETTCNANAHQKEAEYENHQCIKEAVLLVNQHHEFRLCFVNSNISPLGCEEETREVKLAASIGRMRLAVNGY